MYACICAAVPEAVVRTAICRGARTPERITSETRAGSGCGSCHEHLCDMIERLTGERTTAVAAAS